MVASKRQNVNERTPQKCFSTCLSLVADHVLSYICAPCQPLLGDLWDLDHQIYPLQDGFSQLPPGFWA